MKICPNCKVELDEDMETCPLCNNSLSEIKELPVELDNDNESKDLHEDFIPGYEKLTKIQRRKLFWELSGIILFSGIMVTLIIDLVISKGITWSKYSITVCLVLFANTTLLTFWRNRLLIFFGGSFIFSSLLLGLLDLYNLKIGWSIRLGIPIVCSFYLIIVVLTLLVRSAKIKGLNVLAYFFMAIGIFSLCIEGMISIYYLNAIQFTWSLILLVSMIPIAAILSFIHYRLNKGIELKRFFHI